MLRINFYYRYYSVKQAVKNVKKYTDTINLPKTKFPNRLTAAKRAEVEQNLLVGPFANAFSYQAQHNSAPTFVLHDGPPYANGELHMGHAVNKILKDVTLRQHVVQGQKVHYIVGWDCHGLPIELKASSVGGEEVDSLSIRQKSRKVALAAIESQKQDFRSWGILSDWQPANIYLTFQPEFIANQLKLFYNLYERSLVYRDLKPVYWSPSSRTALAEAELEYDPKFVSPSVYVRFELNQLPRNMAVIEQNPIYALVWTTTPWTLLSNQAICYNSALDYVLVRLREGDKPKDNARYLIAKSLVGSFEDATNLKCDVVLDIKGIDMADCSYRHPINEEETDLPFFSAVHVQVTKGTGLVHTAPAHGPEDFLVSLAKKIPVKSFVNEAGLYTEAAPKFLRGKPVLADGNKLILAHIAKNIVHASDFEHAYPIDWRTKQPVIIRASEQWFINTEALKEGAVKEIEERIKFYPRGNAEANKNALIAQVHKRPYWCISRQRVWGVPIPVLYTKHSGKVVTSRNLIAHLCKLLHSSGNIDFWWTKSVADLVPASILSELGYSADELMKGGDIFDIWFDSGSTWSAVLPDDKIADLYLEGYDQFTGWFQSSLLTSMAERSRAPYKALFVHGFTVDAQGFKMSKSLGNVISPKDITKKYGTDALRWWVAAHGTQHMAITVSDNLLQQAAECVSKMRGSLRYMNGIIGDKSQPVQPPNETCHLNSYLLSSLVDFEKEVAKLNANYEYNRVVAVIQNFVANQFSAVYVHLIKDRLYCGDDSDLASIRYTLTKCYEQLCKALWPITPFLVEESWQHHSIDGSGFHMQHVRADPAWKNERVEQVLLTALEVKRLINQQAGDVNSWTLALQLACANKAQLVQLQQLQSTLDACVRESELCEILQVASITLKSQISTEDAVPQLTLHALPQTLCPRCRRYTLVAAESECCSRCALVLKTKCI